MVKEAVVAKPVSVEWGWSLQVRLPCGHKAEVIPSWIRDDGTVGGPLQCTEAHCRRQADVVLKGWVPQPKASDHDCGGDPT